jgi:tRNA A-37 threonylcarbamoyl transferase component Bud32
MELDPKTLETYSLKELQSLSQKMNLPLRKSKRQSIDDITEALEEYKEYRKQKVEKYKRIKQLGEPGKEGTTYLVRDVHGKDYAMKTFRKTKSSNRLRREANFQKIAYKAGISPKVYDYDIVSKYILMQKMDKHLYDVLKANGGVLLKYQQQRIIEIFQILDKIGIFHNDANISNYMLLGKQIYIIDFGFAKEIKNKTNPNMTLMLIGFILKLKELHAPEKSYALLKTYLKPEDVTRFNL